MADRAQLVLPPVGLPGAPRAPFRRASRLRPARLPAQRDARLHPRRARGLLDQPGRRRLGDPVPDRRERRVVAAARTARWDPEAGTIYVWYDALINYITGAGFPDDPAAVRALVAGRPARDRQGHRPLPHDLLAGDALERRPRGAPPRLGPRLAAAQGRRADEQEPGQLLRPERRGRGARLGRRPLRDPAPRSPSTGTPRSAGSRSSGATTPTSPTTSATSSTGRCRWPTATSAGSGPAASDGGALRTAWEAALPAYRAAARGLPAPRRPGDACGSSSARPTGWSTPRSPGSWPRRSSSAARTARPPRCACRPSWATSSRPAGWSPSPARRSCRRPAPRILAQLGYA